MYATWTIYSAKEEQPTDVVEEGDPKQKEVELVSPSDKKEEEAKRLAPPATEPMVVSVSVAHGTLPALPPAPAATDADSAAAPATPADGAPAAAPSPIAVQVEQPQQAEPLNTTATGSEEIAAPVKKPRTKTKLGKDVDAVWSSL